MPILFISLEIHYKILFLWCSYVACFVFSALGIFTGNSTCMSSCWFSSLWCLSTLVTLLLATYDCVSVSYLFRKNIYCNVIFLSYLHVAEQCDWCVCLCVCVCVNILYRELRYCSSQFMFFKMKWTDLVFLTKFLCCMGPQCRGRSCSLPVWCGSPSCISSGSWVTPFPSSVPNTVCTSNISPLYSSTVTEVSAALLGSAGWLIPLRHYFSEWVGPQRSGIKCGPCQCFVVFCSAWQPCRVHN